MTATEELRRMLDERGVEWKAWDGAHPITVWHDETYLYEFIEYRLVNGAKQVSNCPSDNDGHCELTIKVFNCTPEQAIATTLGRGNAGRYVGLRQGEYWERTENSDYYCGGCGWKVTDHDSYCPECGGALHKATLGSSNCTNSERTNGTCLPYWWTHDGTLHVELPKLPESISVRLPDQRDREVRSARTWQYTRDSGTCKLINAADDLGKGTSSCMCFECGYTALDDWWDEFKYCPNCGRRIEVDDG